MARETRLGHALRALPLDDETDRLRADRAADRLDQAVLSINAKGEAVKSLRAYAVAAYVYEAVTGKTYVPVK